MPLWFIFLLSAAPSYAQRLPIGVHPRHYEISLTPDLTTGTLQGHEVISIELESSRPNITLNSVDLQITNAQYVSGAQIGKASITMQPKNEMVELHFPQHLPAGTGRLTIDFHSRLRDDLRGLYRIKAEGRNYAATQFEGTYARMMFPCFDEPEYKATYELTVTLHQDETAISNARIVSDKPGPGMDRRTIRFAVSPKISTYLVALAIGRFDCLEGGTDGVPIRICAVPEKKNLREFALKSAEYFLHFYNGWYGIKYPFGKLDLVAVPDYEWGGMENTASVFFRESGLLIDEKNASVSTRNSTARLIAHEISHQWFGDLVTMKWWDNIWLNEGFATWITRKALQSWDPDWDQNVEGVKSSGYVQQTDSLQTTRAIRANADTPDEIKEMFDDITYSKGAAVLAMVENYTGADVFQRGVNSYLERHANANATAEDFWQEVTRISGKPVDRIMGTFIRQPGLPLVTAKQTCRDAKGQLEISQQRFFASAELMNQHQSPETWQIPVCTRTLSDRKSIDCHLLEQQKDVFALTTCEPALLNAGGSGFYLSEYDSNVLRKLIDDPESHLTPAELIVLLHDQWSLVEIGHVGIDQYLQLAEAFKNMKNRPVIGILLAQLTQIHEKLLEDKDRPAYRHWLRQWLDPLVQDLGLQPALTDTDEDRTLRVQMFEALGKIEDGTAKSTALKFVQMFTKDPGSVDGSLINAAFQVAATNGDEQLYQQFLDALDHTSSPEDYNRYLYALTYFRDPKLAKKSIDFAMSSKMKNQNLPGFFAFLLMSRNRDLVWKFLKEHWVELQLKVVSFGGGGALEVIGEACDMNFYSDVNQFFKKHRAPGAERTIIQGLENIKNCVHLRNSQYKHFQTWLNE